MTDEEYITVEEAARLLKRSESTAWRLIREQGIKTFKRPMDRRSYVRKREIEALQSEFKPRDGQEGKVAA